MSHEVECQQDDANYSQLESLLEYEQDMEDLMERVRQQISKEDFYLLSYFIGHRRENGNF